MSVVLDGAVGDVTVKGPEYSVLKQRVDLDVDFAQQSLKGSTEITLQPLIKNLRQIRLHCRQARPTSIQAGGITAKYDYDDPYRRLRMPNSSNVHQHKMLKEKIEDSIQPDLDPELAILLPQKLKIQELRVDPASRLPQYDGTPSLQKQESDAMAVAGTPTVQSNGPQFAPIKLFIEFEVSSFRDGLHWIGSVDGDKRFPYMYTKASPLQGNTSCIFPCVDDATTRCSWELAIKCPRTLGDAFRKPPAAPHDTTHAAANADAEMVNGVDGASKKLASDEELEPEYVIDLGEEDAAMDLTVVCIGDQVDDVADSEDETRHTVTFSINDPVTARHVGFAIGPFERVDLTAARDADDEDRLGQSAIRVDGYCLPGRGAEVSNTCFPITRAMDHFAVNYGSFPFSSYQVLFVDDLVHDAVPAAGLSFCNSHLLFPEDIIDPLEKNTRVIIRAVAEQWAGVSVVAKTPSDAWAVAGVAGFMADTYGKVLFGNNAFRWQQKLAAERVYDLDADRPSIQQHGGLLHLDPSLREFLDLKSALVLFILDRRLMKNGSSGVQRIINKIFLNAKTGTLENGDLSTADFQRICEKLGHNKLEAFFRQWVVGAGCPIFAVAQRFNKKKLVVEMTITQRQVERKTKPPFAPNNFMREIKEHVKDVWAPETQPVFVGPMTIRIHEADGTPYEHIVEIKEQITKLEIPYNTKYKRLKRSRRAKERALQSQGQNNNTGDGEGGDDALLYCLGDILDTPEEVAEWDLMDWTPEDEERMGQESYEWIRMDADFEWIGKIHLTMPLYMYVSQLQQDRDLVAQYDSMKYLILANPHKVSLSILVRTLMDRRYFHGIRSMAADGLAILAAGARMEVTGGEEVKRVGQFHLEKAFEEMFCAPGDPMPKPNDWNDRTNYIMQCEIPKAMSKLRDKDAKVPERVRQFFLDKLRFNDNSDNPFSDCHYIATLMRCLANSLVVSHREPQPSYAFNFGDDDEAMEDENPEDPFEKDGINAIERYRRIDEWDPTYHNIYSLTALECLQKLTKAGMVKDKAKELMQYTRPTNAALVRIAAFRCLTEIGMTRKMGVMRYLLHSIADDPSSHVRSKLLACFGEALGHIALGDSEPEHSALPPPTAEAEGLLQVEEAVSAEARQLEVARKTTPEGAITALKLALENEEVFKQALWYAATSSITTLDETAELCDVAALLYVPIMSARITLKLPRPWRCENVPALGKGVFRFYQDGPPRTAPRKPLEMEDVQQLRQLGLSYTGPIPEEEVKRRQSSGDEVSLKTQMAAIRETTGSMGPPAAASAPEKPKGFKLNLGAGNKRKASVDVPANAGRAGSPKALKSSRQQTPHAQSPPPPKGRSPSVASQRRGSTPGSKGTGLGRHMREPFKIRISSSAGRARLAEITSRAPQPGGARTLSQPSLAEQNQALTPTTTFPAAQMSPNYFATKPEPQSSLLQSPNASVSPAPPAFNVGSFRSYDSVSDISAVNGAGAGSPPSSFNLGGFRTYGANAAPEVATGPGLADTEAKRESLDASATSPSASSSGATAYSPLTNPVPGLVPAAPSASPLVDGAMAPPPKPKIKLKLGKRPSMDGSAGSPQ